MKEAPIRKNICGAFLLTVLLSGCGYEGDGEYQATGIWPFRNYSLNLPDIQLESNKSEQFDLSGYRFHGRSLVQIVVSSPEPIAFHQLNASVELKIVDSVGTTYFFRSGQLRQHYVRMVEEGKISYALESEWNCDYLYDDPSIDRQVVSFDTDKEPSLQTTLRCWHFAPTNDKDLRLLVKIDDVAENQTDLVLSTKISSGWK